MCYIACHFCQRQLIAGESYLNAWKSISYMARTCMSILFVQWFR